MRHPEDAPTFSLRVFCSTVVTSPTMQGAFTSLRLLSLGSTTPETSQLVSSFDYLSVVRSLRQRGIRIPYPAAFASCAPPTNARRIAKGFAAPPSHARRVSFAITLIRDSLVQPPTSSIDFCHARRFHDCYRRRARRNHIIPFPPRNRDEAS